MNEQTETEPINPLIDTGRFAAAVARRLKEEYEMNRAQQEDMIRRVVTVVLDEHEQKRRSWWKRVLSWIVSQI